MKRSLLLLLLSFPAFCQSYKVAVGSNITTYVFSNSSGVNPISLRSESGLSLQASKEFSLSKVFFLDLGLQYNQFNNVGDIQNIPLSYSTDFVGLGIGVGPSLSLGKGFALLPKVNLSASKMIKGNQFNLNRYIDLSSDEQFNSLRTLYGYSFELSKQVNDQLGLFVKYQHLDSYNFGNSTLNFIPSTFSIGISLHP